MKIKQFINQFILSILMLGCMWGLSLLPISALNTAANWLFICCIGLIIFLGCLTIKVKYFVLIGLVFLKASTCLALDPDACTDAFETSLDEGHWCTYKTLVEEYEEELCSYMQNFNPSSAKTEAAFWNLQEHVTMADRLVQAYGELGKARQAGIGQNCHMLSAKDRNSSLGVRLEKLQSNEGAICCAWAMQVLNEIYNSQYSERQVQTVPMLLADSKTQCWPCDVIYLLIVLVNTMSFRAAPAMAAAGMFFLGVFFLFWIAIKVGMLVLNYSPGGKSYSGAQFLQELFTRILCVFLAALVLGSTAAKYYDTSDKNTPEEVFSSQTDTMLNRAHKEIANPVFEMITATGIEISKTLLNGQVSFYTAVTNAVRNRAYRHALQRIDYCAPTTTISANPIYQYLIQQELLQKSNLTLSGEGFIGRRLTLNMLCLSQLAFQGLSPIAAIGSIFISHAIKNAESLDIVPGRLPLMPQIFYGIILNVVCWIISLLVVLRLIDIALRLAFIIILSPVFIATAAFPLSRGYAAKAVKFFISALMGMIEISLGVSIVVSFFYKAISGANDAALIRAMVAPSSANYVPNLYSFFERGSFVLLIYIFGIAWLSMHILDGVQKFFEATFGIKSVSAIAGKATLDSIQLDLRRGIGQGYDFAKGVKTDSQGWKVSFRSRMKDGKLSKAAGFVGKGAGKLQGHTAVAAKRFYEGAKNTRLGRAAVNAGHKVKNGYNTVKNGAKKVADAIKKTPLGKVLAFAGKGAMFVAKRTSSFVKHSARQAVYNYFHPDQKKRK